MATMKALIALAIAALQSPTVRTLIVRLIEMAVEAYREHKRAKIEGVIGGDSATDLADLLWRVRSQAGRQIADVAAAARADSAGGSIDT